MQARRKELGLTASALAERTAELGYPVSRVAIGKIETGHREGKLDLAELVVLGAALRIPPVMMVYPDLPDGQVELLPGREKSSVEALAWFTGDTQLADGAVTDPDSFAGTLLKLTRQRSEKQRMAQWAKRAATTFAEQNDEEKFTPAMDHALKLMDEIGEIDSAIGKLIADREEASK